MNAKSIIEISKDDLDGFLEEQSQKMLANRYAAVRVGSATVCEIWGIAPETLSLYIKKGRIAPINKGSSKYQFSLADVLRENPRYKHI